MSDEISAQDRQINKRSAADVTLPPDGTLIRVGTWRIKVAWVGTFIIGLIVLSVLVQAIQIGRPVALLSALAGIFGLAVFIRIPLSGVIIEAQGVKARSVWWTYQWRWGEIERFELRDKGEKPRFRIRLRDGRTKGFVGFFTQSQSEEERGRALFKALEERLEVERAKLDAFAEVS
jgi:hypothetical protein